MTDSLLGQTEYPDRDFHAELVGDGKKFKDDKELAKGKWYADEMLKTNNAKMDQMREELLRLQEENAASKKLNEMLDQWQNRSQLPPETQTLIQDKSPSIDAKQIESLIDNRMQEREQSRKHTDNLNYVKTKLTEQYGRDYNAALSQQMTDLGISETYLNDMAKTSPKALLKMLGIDETPQVKDPFRAPPRNVMNQSQYKPPQEERTWSWYQKLKEENPKKWASRETNVQMHNDAIRLGERFNDGDFDRYERDFRISY